MTKRAFLERLENAKELHAKAAAAHETHLTPETNAELAARNAELKSILESWETSSDADSLQGKAAGFMKDYNSSFDNASAEITGKATQVESKGKTVGNSSWGSQFVNNDAFDGWLKSGARGDSPKVELKAGPVTSTRPASGNSTAPDHLDAGGLLPILRLPDVDLVQRRRFLWSDLFSQVPVNTGAFEWMQMLDDMIGGDALETPENTTKPETAGFQYARRTGTVKNIAVWMDATKQVLEDIPRMQSMINNKLTKKVRSRINHQLALGDGTGDNLLGLIHANRALPAHTIGVDPLFIAVLKTIMEIELGGAATEDEDLFTVTGLAMHPNTWYSDSFVTARDTTGRFIMVDPTQRIDQTTAWGLPVITSKKIPAGRVLVGDFSMGTMYTREDVTLDMTNSDASKFRNNVLTFRAEARVGFEVESTAAFKMVQP
jgi:HK97 family phage major capsid protein